MLARYLCPELSNTILIMVKYRRNSFWVKTHKHWNWVHTQKNWRQNLENKWEEYTASSLKPQRYVWYSRYVIIVGASIIWEVTKRGWTGTSAVRWSSYTPNGRRGGRETAGIAACPVSHLYRNKFQVTNFNKKKQFSFTKKVVKDLLSARGFNPSCRHRRGPWACATVRSACAGRPACPSSGAAPCPTRCSRAPLCRWAPKYRCDRSRRQSRPAALSVNTSSEYQHHAGRFGISLLVQESKAVKIRCAYGLHYSLSNAL